jgi:hypothetical protein
LDKIAKILKENSGLKPGALISLLNPRMRGWAQYYDFTSASAAFHGIDESVWKMFLHYLKKHYPKTAVSLLIRDHFSKVGTSLVPKGLDEQGKPILLYRMINTKLGRLTVHRTSPTVMVRLAEIKVKNKKTKVVKSK